MCTERVRGWAQFGHGEMFGILVKVLLSRRLLEDAGPADFGVELDLPLSTTAPCHELSFQREDWLSDFDTFRPSVRRVDTTPSCPTARSACGLHVPVVPN